MPRSISRVATLALLIVALATGACAAGADDADRPGAEYVTAALFAAVESDNAWQVDALIKNGVDIEVRNAAQKTPLILAANKNSINAARVLIEAGADVNAIDVIKDSAYLYAGAEGHVEILEMTLAHGANLKATNRYGGTALIPAAEKGHLDAVRILLAAGVDVNHVNDLGWTALQEAIVLNDGDDVHTAIVGALLDGGADPNLPDRDGHTPLFNAEHRNQPAIAALLRKAGGHT